MVECQFKGLCYNCDDKYFPRQECKEHKLFMAITEDVSDEDVVVSPMDGIPPPSHLAPPFDPPEVEPVISLNALTSFFSS
jgi:hypothetical protein